MAMNEEGKFEDPKEEHLYESIKDRILERASPSKHPEIIITATQSELYDRHLRTVLHPTISRMDYPSELAMEEVIDGYFYTLKLGYFLGSLKERGFLKGDSEKQRNALTSVFEEIFLTETSAGS